MGGLGIRIQKQNYDPYYVLGILNSKVSFWYIKTLSRSIPGGYYSFEKKYSLEIPIRKIEDKNQTFNLKLINHSKEVSNRNKIFLSKSKKFISRIKSSFGISRLSNKILKFWKLSFDELQKEIYRLIKRKLSLTEQDEWEDYFNQYKKEIIVLKEGIAKIEKDINEIVYKLYNITEKEENIIEES